MYFIQLFSVRKTSLENKFLIWSCTCRKLLTLLTKQDLIGLQETYSKPKYGEERTIRSYDILLQTSEFFDTGFKSFLFKENLENFCQVWHVWVSLFCGLGGKKYFSRIHGNKIVLIYQSKISLVKKKITVLLTHCSFLVFFVYF